MPIHGPSMSPGNLVLWIGVECVYNPQTMMASELKQSLPILVQIPNIEQLHWPEVNCGQSLL